MPGVFSTCRARFVVIDPSRPTPGPVRRRSPKEKPAELVTREPDALELLRTWREAREIGAWTRAGVALARLEYFARRPDRDGPAGG